MKALVTLIAFLSLVQTINSLAAGASDCPPTVQRLSHLHVYTDSCLVFVRTAKNWEDARKACQRLGGDLVTIKSADKQKYLLNALRADRWSTNQVWIGANDRAKEGHWTWPDGSKLVYGNFASGQGNNHNGGFLFTGGSTEDCAVLRRDDGGRWHDYPCTPPVLGIGYHYSYICEFPRTVRASTVAPYVSTTMMITTKSPTTPASTQKPSTVIIDTQVQTTAKATRIPTTFANKETPAPTTMANKETPAPTTMMNKETPAPTTMANKETPAPTTMANKETPAPTTMANKETPAPTTMANMETPAPTTTMNKETSVPTTMAQKETPLPTAIIGRRRR